MNRRLRKAMGFDAAKGLAVRLFYYLLFFRFLIPRFVFHLVLHAAGLAFKITWFMPFHPWRRNARNASRAQAQELEASVRLARQVRQHPAGFFPSLNETESQLGLALYLRPFWSVKEN